MAWSNESRQSRGYGSLWDKIRKRVVERDQGMCQKCKRDGRVTAGKEVDHITPKAEAAKRGWTQAQTDAMANLELLCTPCHLEKSAKDKGRTYRPKVQIGEDGWPVV